MYALLKGVQKYVTIKDVQTCDCVPHDIVIACSNLQPTHINTNVSTYNMHNNKYVIQSIGLQHLFGFPTGCTLLQPKLCHSKQYVH